MSPEQLQRFCASPEEIRWYLQSPWRANGFIYASNGHVCIEIPDDGRELKDSGAKYPDVRKSVFDRYTSTDFAPMPALVPIEIAGACEQCEGAGTHGEIECVECDGVGDFEKGRRVYTCGCCDGVGSIGDNDKPTICLACDGYGEPGNCPEAHRTVLGEAEGIGFQTRYLRLFAGLPGVEVALNGLAGAAVFRFDGGAGAVMPTRA